MRKTLILIMTIVISIDLFGQNVQVKAAFDSTAILIGEQTMLTLAVATNGGEEDVYVFPTMRDTLAGGLELLDAPKMDTMKLEDGTVKISAHYLMTGWDSALVYIEALPVVNGGDTFWSNGVTLKVVEIPVDTVDAICDIKPVYDPPFDWKFFWTVVLIVVLSMIFLSGLVWVYFRYFRKKSQMSVEKTEEVKDYRPAHIIAMEQLEELRREKLWQDGRIKLYYSRLTEIVKGYISRRYDINAIEKTTDELLGEMRMNTKIEVSKNSVENLKELLQLADLVKFAKWNPLPEENNMAFEEGKNFVQLTKQEGIKEEAKNDIR